MKQLPNKVWVRVYNSYANDWNGEPEYEMRQYKVLAIKEKCVVIGRKGGKCQYPWDQVFATKEECEEYWAKKKVRNRHEML